MKSGTPSLVVVLDLRLKLLVLLLGEEESGRKIMWLLRLVLGRSTLSRTRYSRTDGQ